MGLGGSADESPPAEGHSTNLAIRREFTDRQRHAFADQAFEQTARHFENSLKQLQQTSAGAVEYVFRRVDTTSFEATAYVGGRERSRCGVWVRGGEAFSRNRELGYCTGGVGDRNSYNEMLHVEDDGTHLYLRPIMGRYGLVGEQAKHELSVAEAAEYLWAMFMAPMQ